MTYSVGIDMGGTFTDGVFSNGELAVSVKVPTTHFDLTRSVMACLAGGATAFDASLEDFLGDVGLFRLATTIGTNAVVTGTGDTVGLIVEAGAEKSLYGPSDPAPALGAFVSPDHVVGVDPDSAAEEVLRMCRGLVQGGVRQTVVSLRTERREHEARLRELVRDRYPAHYLRSMPLTMGRETAGTEDDAVRTSTAVLNAYLSRPMAKLLYRTEGILQRAGLTVPLLAARSDGTCSRAARTTAISTYSSGPAAGLGLAAAESLRHGDAAAVAFDMGGTTLDLGLVLDGAFDIDPTPEIRGVQVSLPVAGIVSVGLGGSSIACVDSSGVVTVGPASAGAVPGPAAFGRGGTEPTLTDADVVLGLLDEGHVLPGDIVLDVEPACDAIAPLAGGEPVDAALMVRAAAHAKAAAALRSVLADAGVDAVDATLYAFGGAGPLHVGGVAESAGIGRVRSFAHSGVYSARGLVDSLARQRYEASMDPGEQATTVLARLLARARLDLQAERLPVIEARVVAELVHSSGAAQTVEATVDGDLAEAASRVLAAVGFVDGAAPPIAAVAVETLSLPPEMPAEALRALVAGDYTTPGTGSPARRADLRRGGSSVRGDDVAAEVIDAGPRAPRRGSDAQDAECGDRPADDPWPADQRAGERNVCWPEGVLSTLLVDLDDLTAGEAVHGPALVECAGSVHAIPPRWSCRRVDADGLLWERSR